MGGAYFRITKFSCDRPRNVVSVHTQLRRTLIYIDTHVKINFSFGYPIPFPYDAIYWPIRKKILIKISFTYINWYACIRLIDVKTKGRFFKPRSSFIASNIFDLRTNNADGSYVRWKRGPRVTHVNTLSITTLQNIVPVVRN